MLEMLNKTVNKSLLKKSEWSKFLPLDNKEAKEAENLILVKQLFNYVFLP